MISTRIKTFETNSSSTHSICIPKRLKFNPINKVNFRFGDFGWEEAQVDPASYLYTAICNLYDDGGGGEDYADRTDRLDRIKEILDRHDIKYYFQPIKRKQWYNSKHEYEDIGSIDRCSELYGLIDSLLKDEEMLIRYLSEAEIYTGNDNVCGSFFDDEDNWDFRDSELAYNRPEPDKYDYFYKGN